jgi:predicted ATP-grasp superfamily ATP-dependent carboligase
LKLLVFEFSVANGLNNPSLTLEGQCMLDGLLKDLNGYEVDYLIMNNSSINLENLVNGNDCHPIEIKNNLSLWLDENITNYDACLPLAPEEDFTSFYLTKMIEDNNVKVIGSNSDAVMICSDKFQTYTVLKDKVPFIKTSKIFYSELKDYKKFFNTPREVVVKPADGVSCKGVKIIRSYSDFIKASACMKRLTKLPYFLLQDYINGISISVSLLTNGIISIPLSCNLQNLSSDNDNLIYDGGIVPFEHDLSVKAKSIAKKAVDSLDGLKGYVGVDLLLDDKNGEIYIIELNPRLTTPYVALRRLLNFNLGDAIIKSAYGELPLKIVLNGAVTFYKEDNQLMIK